MHVNMLIIIRCSKNVVFSIQIPQSPLWLLSKKRSNEAIQALRFLRGWAPETAIAEEFQSLQQYSNRSEACESCFKKQQICTHAKPTQCERLNEFTKKSTLKAVFITVSLITITTFITLFININYLERIFRAYNVTITAKEAMTLLNYGKLLGIVAFLCVDRFIGKRKLYLIMLAVTFFSIAIVAGYGFFETKCGHIPLVCIVLVIFCSGCGVYSMSDQIISVAFRYKFVFFSNDFRRIRSSFSQILQAC